jgi:hypothetical protein
MSVSYNDVTAAAHAEQWDHARDLALSMTKDNPNDAKSWYYLAQTDVHLGNLVEAKEAVDRADKIDPLHTYVGNMNAYTTLRAKLAVTDQTVMVKTQNDYSVTHPGEGSHPYAVGFFVLAFALIAAYVINRLIKNGAAKRAAEAAAEEARVLKQRADAKLDSYGSTQLRGYHSSHNAERAAAEVRSTPARVVPQPVVRPATYASAPAAPAPASTVVVNNNSGSDLATGVILGSMLSDHHHDTTVVVERESAPSRSSYDDAPSRSSSFDSGSSSSYSSRSDDSDYSSSSSSSSSGWDSGSSSSSYDSGSSSSWDSGSSSSFDSGSSSSDW